MRFPRPQRPLSNLVRCERRISRRSVCYPAAIWRPKAILKRRRPWRVEGFVLRSRRLWLWTAMRRLISGSDRGSRRVRYPALRSCCWSRNSITCVLERPWRWHATAFRESICTVMAPGRVISRVSIWCDHGHEVKSSSRWTFVSDW